MRFCYGGSELRSDETAQQNTFLLTNGLGGYSSVSSAFGVPRCDQGILVAAVKAPNVRINLVHRISETLTCNGQQTFLSDQHFADGTPREEGLENLRNFTVDDVPCWEYEICGVHILRKCVMDWEKNTTAVLYEICNDTDDICTLELTPYFKFAPKEEAVRHKKIFLVNENQISCEQYALTIYTDGDMTEITPVWQTLSYPEDDKDGRPDRGMAGSCVRIAKTVQPGVLERLEVVFTTEDVAPSGWELLVRSTERMRALENTRRYDDPVAMQLVCSADAYIARRDSTDGKTILAGYPLFSDWGRDTMIALPGCCLATGRYEDAKSILRTFLAYEKDGLVPNLFPEGDQTPMYNTVDAALLLIDSIWQYAQTCGDWNFVREAWPVMERVIACYREGTHHAIGMDADGLLFAGAGLDQVTWMDVCVQGILPTPRHGKPVEINAYWYNALRIMDELAEKLDFDRRDYGKLAQKVQKSFCEKFFIPEKGYLRDVLSGTDADEQIRCNQIWALTMPFTMLTDQQEQQVLDTVRKHLYTPFGLRTLSPEDPQYQPFYGGDQLKRDLAYHQGTTWVFPMGAYYRACLKVGKYAAEVVQTVKIGLKNLMPMLTQGCAGQLPEIYDGDHPGEGKGCFAQAWSVSEILRVYEVLDSLEKGNKQ